MKKETGDMPQSENSAPRSSQKPGPPPDALAKTGPPAEALAKAGYKHTPLGWLPKEWEVVQISKISKITSGGTPDRKKSSYWQGDIPWVTTSLIDFNVIEKAEEFITEKGLNNSSAKIFPKNTVIMALYGQGVTRGKVAMLGIEAATNQACAAFLLNEKKVFPMFHFFNLANQYEVLRNLSNDGSQKNLSGALLKTFKIPLPPLPEQQQIAAILSAWDRAIGRTQALIAAKEERRRGVMRRLLAPKASWKSYKYSQIIKEVRRPIDFNDDELYDLISVRRRSGGLFHRERLYGHQILTKDLREAKKGDFLISKMQIVHGASGLTTPEFDGMKISGSYIAVVSKDPKILDIRYFNWLSKLPWFYHQTYISSYGVHIEKMTFDFKSFLKQEVSIPSLEEQKKCVQILNLIDKEVDVLNEKLEALKDQKKGLMQRLLTGKIRVG